MKSASLSRLVHVYVGLVDCVLALQQVDQGSEPEWSRLTMKGDVPSKRSGHTITEVGGKFMLFAGAC